MISYLYQIWLCYGSEILLDAAPFWELRALDSAELNICSKLTDLCIEVCMHPESDVNF